MSIAAEDREDARVAELLEDAAEVRDALRAALEWIDALPADLALPAMPGFDRDWVEGVLERTI